MSSSSREAGTAPALPVPGPDPDAAPPGGSGLPGASAPSVAELRRRVLRLAGPICAALVVGALAQLVVAALLGIDREIMEAAALDGAHGLRLLRGIAVPAVAGTIAAAFVIRLVLALKIFDLVDVMTKGGPGDASSVPAWLVWKAAIEQFDVGRGAAITLLLALVVTIITLPPILIARRSHG